jgi:hypothetical protein
MRYGRHFLSACFDGLHSSQAGFLAKRSGRVDGDTERDI